MQERSREAYEKLYSISPHPDLYGSPWWLDATCGPDGWEVFTYKGLIENETSLIPYHQSVIQGMKAIVNPPMTQWLPVLSADSGDETTIANFLKGLPSYSILDVAFKPPAENLNSLVSHRVRFRYSFKIHSNENIRDVRAGYNEGLRRNLREAENIYTIQESDDVNTLIELCKSTYRMRQMKAPAWVENKVPAVYEALIKHKKGRLEFGLYEGKPIAAVLTGWDDNTHYYLAGGRAAGERAASAHSLVLDHAIAYASEQNSSFDFEGSMNPGIANFFQSFGAQPYPYWHIQKFNGLGKLWVLFH
jgi:hypothetical protein